MCPLDYPTGAQPNGFGAWCYSDSITCMEGPNSCTNSEPCALDLTTCSTGVAGDLRGGGQRDLRGSVSATVYGHTCSFDTPMGGTPNGGGKICYDTLLHCQYGPNSWCVSEFRLCFIEILCSILSGMRTEDLSVCLDSGADHPCTVDYTSCSTGPAGGSGSNYYCDLDSPKNALANGAGSWCYNSFDACNSGANNCGNDTLPCEQNPSFCSTGVASGVSSTYNWACLLDVPPGALPMASGAYCYSNSLSCLQGPNGCSVSYPCLQMYATCSTGLAGGSRSHSYFCPHDIPNGAIPNGGGQAWAVMFVRFLRFAFVCMLA